MKQTYINHIFRNTLLLLFTLYSLQTQAQYKVRYNNDNLTTITLGPEKQNGFRISLSLVALFTSGVADRNGIRIGAGITLSQTLDNWVFSLGTDTYKANQKFGLGTSFAGITFESKNYGATYYVNKYYQGDRQISGLISLYLDDFQINFEDDILAFPFTGFKAYDRYRTAALELRYKGLMIGTNVYTTDIDGVTDASTNNSKGSYLRGKQISSPIYVGYTKQDLILRYGLNSKLGGLIGQNIWHQLFFGSPNFEYGSYKNSFLQIGVDKPYTLY
ncbi:MAG: polymorphic toxin type 23 domain-containing protein [Dysgonomonas sp.]